MDMEEIHNRLYAVKANECPPWIFSKLQTPKASKERAKPRERENFNTELSKSGNQRTSNPQMGKQKVSGKKGERPGDKGGGGWFKKKRGSW